MALSSRPAGVRYVKLRALSTQGASPFMDVAEIQVFALLPTVTAAPAARRRRPRRPSQAQVPDDVARQAEQAPGVRLEARRAQGGAGEGASSP